MNGRLQATRILWTALCLPLPWLMWTCRRDKFLDCFLYYIHISDFQEVLSYCSYSFYADDLMIYFHCEPCALRDDIAYVNSDVCRIVAWASANKLILNCDKTQAIIMGSSRHVNAIDLDTLPCIKVNDVDVRYTSQVKYLGVTITGSLS